MSSHENAATVTLAGTARPDSRVEITDWTIPVGITLVDSTGHWTEVLLSVSEGTHIYRARALDTHGNALGTSALYTVNVNVDEAASPAPAPRRVDRRYALGAVAALALVVVAAALYLVATRSGGSSRGASGGRPQGTARPPAVVPAAPSPLPTARKPGPPRATPVPVIALKATPHPVARRIARPTATPIPPRPTATPTSTPTATATPTATPTRPAPRPRPVIPPKPTPTKVRQRKIVARKSTPVRTRPRRIVVPRPAPTAVRPTRRVRPARVLPTHIPATPVPVVPTPPQAARSWTFAALPPTSGQVILTLSNQNPVPVDVTIRTSSHAQQIRVPAASGAEMELSSHDASQALAVTATAPILPARLVIRHQTVRITYGTPGPTKGTAPL